MHRLTSTFVLGYHGCSASVAEKLVMRKAAFESSENGYDWLGDGIYFWLENPKRACDWALKRAENDPRWLEDKEQPAVVGAVIELGLCLDLTTAVGIEEVKTGYEVLSALTHLQGTPMPENTSSDNNGDILVRRLDCAVINTVHQVKKSENKPGIDTVKGVFTEGPSAFPGAAIREKTHVQLAVVNYKCIRGVFYVPEDVLSGRALKCKQTRF